MTVIARSLCPCCGHNLDTDRPEPDYRQLREGLTPDEADMLLIRDEGPDSQADQDSDD